MGDKEKLKRSLRNLEKITGLSMEIDWNQELDVDFAVAQIDGMIGAYKEKYNTSYFLQNLITGNLEQGNIVEGAAKLHISLEEKRTLFLIEIASKNYSMTETLLKQLFHDKRNTYLVKISKNRLAVLYPIKEQEDLFDLGNTIVDTINMELYVNAKLSFSQTFDSLLDLEGAYKKAHMTMEIGKIFQFGKNVFPYNDLGIGQMIREVPYDVCRNFLLEVFKGEIPDFLDEEYLIMVHTFFTNNLNIAETARGLHMHRNTLIYRIEQLEKKTGMDIRKFEDALVFKVALMVVNYLKIERVLI
ncbi:carbohydrate diacid regulator [Aequitasia blattaphilus]|uniref:Helix-turn-helix domain-containing protein n=1 Tax=Aequitasia blattaphilus TaxID=2949332 RepID=A0ABT1E934_9FIRM|nr:helix-turn-helix domain-containing protein [Aequitasia blattaphilus]MCP1102349.1 helix-turn-helix domain-containing protein [Aequitasia blattaphilus]MCR8614989.1 helix-turn-helix domain-containing protein [Aequitasia blattaphilus]